MERTKEIASEIICKDNGCPWCSWPIKQRDIALHLWCCHDFPLISQDELIGEYMTDDDFAGYTIGAK